MTSIVHAYDLLVTSKGGFFEPLVDAEGNIIGERFQIPVLNASGDRIGTNQGYGYIFPDITISPYNQNRNFFLDDGEMNVMNQVIVAATGRYEKYTGGSVFSDLVSQYPDYILEITLLETETSLMPCAYEPFRVFEITSEGGYYLPFTSPDGKQIGEMFQNPIFVQNMPASREESIGSINQGFSFNFDTSRDSFIGSNETSLQNRVFFLPCGRLTVLDLAIVQGTGAYTNYTGGSLDEVVISQDPHYVSQITLREKEPYDVNLANLPDVSLLVNEFDASWEPILNGNGSEIGDRVHAPISNQNGTRVGSMLAYFYLFPDPVGQTLNGNVKLYLEDGNLTIFNNILVRATGVYAGYVGGRASIFERNITLIPPSPSSPSPPMEELYSAGKRVTKTHDNLCVLLVAALASLIWA